jgi:hypothetical protein
MDRAGEQDEDYFEVLMAEGLVIQNSYFRVIFTAD